MGSNPNTPDPASLLRRALATIERLESQLSQVENSHKEPLAVVAMGCRFPGGANEPSLFWERLMAGFDGITQVPPERWDIEALYDPDPAKKGKIATKWGGFLQGLRADEFDAAFFNITPREAAEMDPQQRLLLEVVWETLEMGGFVPSSLEHSRTGVFVGISTNDYIYATGAFDTIGQYHGSGVSHSVAAGRVSFLLGLHGPSIAVDTACSSSLVALHSASQALRQRDCDMALVAGVNMMVSPETTYYFSQGRFMAPDGHCKTFDASADGYARGEGCGCVALKRLSDALRDKDTIYALVRGSAVNHGGPSSGLTVPNGPAQQVVIREALAAARLQPRDVTYVEAHGTGTSLGDPIEVEALGSVHQERKVEERLFLGSVKTSIGHLEAAAGMAGVIKAALALHHEEIPGQLGPRRLSPYLRFSEQPIVVPSASVRWPRSATPRRAGVSSFAFQGTNAHVVLEEAPASASETLDRAGIPERPAHLLCLSARAPEALRQLAARYHRFLQGPDGSRVSLADLCFTANACRDHFAHRLAIVVPPPHSTASAAAGTTQPNAELFASLRASLEAYLQETTPSSVLTGKASSPRQNSRVAVLVTEGCGTAAASLLQMSRSLPVLRRAVEQGAAVTEKRVSKKLQELAAASYETLSAAEKAALDCVVASALRELWRACGVAPAVVCAAAANHPLVAVVAGVVTLDDAVALAIWRAHAAGRGATSAAPRPSISSQAETAAILAADTGQRIPDEQARDVAFWTGKLSASFEPQRLIAGMIGEGCDVFLSFGGARELARLRRHAPDGYGVWLWGADDAGGCWTDWLTSLGALYAHGFNVDWRGLDRDLPRTKVALPTYPFQRRRHWVERAAKPAEAVAHTARLYRPEWQEAPRDKSNSRAAADHLAAGTWLLFCDRREPFAAFESFVRGRGGRVRYALAGDTYSLSADEARLRLTEPQDLLRLLSDCATRGERPVGVLYAAGGSGEHTGTVEEMGREIRRSLGGLLHIVQALDEGHETALLCLTRGVWRVRGDEPQLSPLSAPLIGFCRVVALEQSHVRCRVADLDPAAPMTESIAEDLLVAAADPDGERDLAYRDGRRYICRLKAQPTEAPKQLTLREAATYVVTGGLGGLGMRLAQWLADRGARRIALLDRMEPTPQHEGELERLRKIGVDVQCRKVDLGSAEATASAFAAAAKQGYPVRGIVHAAGIIADASIRNLDLATLEQVMAPKALGAWNTHLCALTGELDFFVLFSSLTAVLGNEGQAAYAAGNAFCDALAHSRRAAGLPATSVNWGLWGGSGMGSRTDRTAEALKKRGIAAMATEEGLALLEEAIASTAPQIIAAAVDWPTLLATPAGREHQLFLAQLAGRDRPVGAAVPEKKEDAALLLELSRAPASDKAEILVAYLLRKLAEISGIDRSALTPDTNILNGGVDSIMLMDLVRACRDDLGLVLYPREFLGQPIVKDLASYLVRELGGQESAGSLAASAAVSEAPVAAPPPQVPATAGSSRPRRRSPANPAAVFVLSAPRSGSTLLRVMLGGHPGLFCPPELHLLQFEQMQARQASLAASYLDEGLLVALESLGVSEPEKTARAWMEEDASIQQVFARLQELARPRILVDKSPTYASSTETLRRAEAIFSAPKYVLLVRHPYAVIESFLRMRMDKLVASSAGDRLAGAERVWTDENRNVLEFFASLGAPERTLVVQYERLVANPEPELRAICKLIGVSFVDQMLKPYEGERMVRGRSSASLPIGDQNFLSHSRVEAELGDAWRKIKLPRRLSGGTAALARKLGYELPHDELPVGELADGGQAGAEVRTRIAPARDKAFGGMREETASINGLRLCVCDWGDAGGAPVLCVHGLFDSGAAWAGVAAILAERGRRVVAPDLRGHGLSEHAPTYYLTDHLKDLDRIVEKKIGEGPFSLVAHSMGAAVALMLAAVRSHQIASMLLVEPVVPSPTSLGEDAAGALRAFLAARGVPRDAKGMASVDEAVERLRAASPNTPAPLLRALAIRNTVASTTTVQWRADRALEFFVAVNQAWSLQPALLKELPPCRIVYATTHTHVKTQELTYLREWLKPIQTHALEGGHNLHLEQSQEIATLLLDRPERQ